MAKKRAELSKGELLVASALWRLKSASLGEIHSEVLRVQPMEYTTVQSYVRRLETKGYVKSKRSGRSKVYVPRANPDSVISQVLNQMIEHMFAGDAVPVFRHLIKDRGISETELAELREIIEESEGEQADD